MKNLLAFLLIIAITDGEKDNSVHKTYTYRKGFCSGTIILYDDYRFFRERGCGCDGASDISTGMWRMKGDTLSLSSLNTCDVVLIKDVLRTRKNHNGKTHIRFLSIEGDTINNNLDPDFLKKSGEVLPIDYSVWESSTDNKDYILDTTGSTGVIEVRKLSVRFDTTVYVDTKGYNDITIVLNLPNICLWSSSFEYEYDTLEKLLLKRNDTLLDIPVHDFGWKYTLEHTK